MITTQQQLDACLDRQHTIPVVISPDGPLPAENHAYDSIRNLPQTGFTFTPRELLHAIGCKTAALPSSATDECIKAAWLYTHILDLESDSLAFQGTYGSDLQTPRSQEIGIGMMCLLSEKYLNIPWDQLGPLPGVGKRFDYRGANGGYEAILECKGTSDRGKQLPQIANGLDKKSAHHDRGEHFDIELIVSSYIGHGGEQPRIFLADPDKSSLRELYERGDKRFYRLRHYCRVLQFVGLPDSAYHLNKYARQYLDSKKSIYKRILSEKEERGFLEPIIVEGDEFLGRWFDSWLPKESKRYKKQYAKEDKLKVILQKGKRFIFQGLRRDVYEAGLEPEPFTQDLVSHETIRKYTRFQGAGVSVFPDGTIMMFRQD